MLRIRRTLPRWRGPFGFEPLLHLTVYQTKQTPFGVCLFGTPSGVRTLDTLIKSQVLCQLS